MSREAAPRPALLSGIKPTNRLTLGNYLGALRNWVSLQEQYRCFFAAVDLHSITVKQDPRTLRDNTLRTIAAFLASGIDANKAVVFIQSHVPEHAELAWILSCFTYMGELNRMTQFKDKSTQAGKNIPVGLFTYPALMAADILLYDTDLVPVGEDQKQHLELTRDLAVRMNRLLGEDTFRIPKPYIGAVGARIMDLQNPLAKMGKSDSATSGAIYLDDTDRDIEKKIKRAVTDSRTAFEPDSLAPGVVNLLDIQSAFTKKSVASLVEHYTGKSYGTLKQETAETVITHLHPIRQRLEALLHDPDHLMRTIHNGAAQASAVARRTLTRVTGHLGFVNKN